MSTSAKLILEILDSTNQWVDRTTDLMHAQIKVGRSYGGYTSDIGQAQFTLNNRAQTYNSTANLDEGYRVRVKASGASLGNCLQVQYGGTQAFNTNGFKQYVTQSVAVNDVFLLTWDARAQYDSQYNTDNVIIEGTGQGHEVTYTYTNKWATYTLSFTAGLTDTFMGVRWDRLIPTGAVNNTRMLEYRNISLTKNGGANQLINGNFANGFTGWTAIANAGTTVTTVTNDYWIIFNGVIETISPAPFANAGTFQVQVTASDLMRWMKQKVDLPLQKNQTADQLNTTLLSQINNGSYSKTVLLDVPMAYYRLDESSGSTAQDISGNALNGTYIGGVTLGTGGALYGDPDTAATFNGSTGEVSLPTLNFVGLPYSIEAWIKTSSLAATQVFAYVQGIFCIIDTTGRFRLGVTGGGAIASTNGTIAVNTWYHLVATYNATTGISTIYINGVNITNGTPGTVTAGLVSVIGNDTSTDWFNGVIDEVAIYNFPLTDAQVLRHYNAGIGTYNTVKLPGKQQTSGLQSFPTAFDRYDKQSVSIANALREVANSEYGIQWMDRDGTFRFGARDYLPKLIVSPAKLTLSDGMPFNMTLSRSSAQLTNHVTMTYHPRNTVTATIVLGQITSPLAIPGTGGGNLTSGGFAGNRGAAAGTPTSQSVTLTFVDATGNKIGGDSVIYPVANIDYKVFERADGTGFDYTADDSFSIGPIVISASQVTITMTNKATGTLYVTKLQVRGNGVYTYNPITITVYDASSIIAHEDRPYVTDLAFSADGDFAQSLATYILTRFGTSYLEAISVAVDYKTQLNGTDLLSIELMDMIIISDVQTGLSGIKHLIDSIAYTFDYRAADGLQNITIGTSRLDQTTYFILNDSTYAVLGSTTTLYI
jgi:hypothetical protein